MNLPKFARTWLLKREIARGVALQRIAREARAKAAQRGISTEWKNRARKCREVFQ